MRTKGEILRIVEIWSVWCVTTTYLVYVSLPHQEHAVLTNVLIYVLSVHRLSALRSSLNFSSSDSSHNHHLMVALNCYLSSALADVLALWFHLAGLQWLNSTSYFILTKFHSAPLHLRTRLSSAWWWLTTRVQVQINLQVLYLSAPDISFLHPALTRWNPLNHLCFSTAVIIPTALFCISDSSISTWRCVS